uniref:Uncharacterized protein n=1 Tax=Parascaris univalens TaxID=6257 RepID=A0A915BXL6_PARUN
MKMTRLANDFLRAAPRRLKGNLMDTNALEGMLICESAKKLMVISWKSMLIIDVIRLTVSEQHCPLTMEQTKTHPGSNAAKN